MSDDEASRSIVPTDESRRGFLQKGALSSGAFAFGLGSLGFTDSGVVMQTEGNETETPGTETPVGTVDEGGEALMFNDEFRAGAQFRVKSPVINEDPAIRNVAQDTVFGEYNTRAIEYLNTDEEVYLFPAEDAEVEQGVVYELHDEYFRFDDASPDSGILDVRFERVPEEDVLVPDEDNRFEPMDDFDVVEGGGKALVDVRNFSPGALLEITSGVVEWTPGPDVQGSDIFSTYNTRHARYLNTNDEFLIYPAGAADVEEGGVYLMQNEFDVTDPEGQLVTADLDRVDEDDLDDAWFEDDDETDGGTVGDGVTANDSV